MSKIKTNYFFYIGVFSVILGFVSDGSNFIPNFIKYILGGLFIIIGVLKKYGILK